MKNKTPREIAVEWFERVWGGRSRDALVELMTASTVAHQEGGGTVTGPEEFARFQDALLTAFPDLSLRVLRAVGDDEQACVHWEFTATHRGEFFGIPPTDRPVRCSGMTFMVVRNGRIIEGWDSWNLGALVAGLS